MNQKEMMTQALNRFAQKMKKDPNVVAMLLYGSLAYGTVSRKSDIDLELIVRDGTQHVQRSWFALEEDGVAIDISSISELAVCKQYLQRKRDGFDHGIYGKGVLVFSKDEAFTALFEEARKLGSDDAPVAFAGKILGLVNWMHKAEKWVTVEMNTLYAQRFLQLCAPIVAEMELIRHQENPNREAILRAQQLNPELMHEIFTLPSTTAMTEAGVRRALQVLDDYLMRHMSWWSKHVLDFLRDGEAQTASHICKCCGSVPLDYLAEKGVLAQTTLPARLFKHSKLTVEEKAYVYMKEEKTHE